jgi:hypothetical protein
MRLPRRFTPRNDNCDEIATLPSVARNDIFILSIINKSVTKIASINNCPLLEEGIRRRQIL